VGRFTFATGNARKLLALPLYGLGALTSTVVPRDPRLWVFGSGTGVGEGALALLEHARAADPSLRIVWLTRNERDAADARARGIRSAPKMSWRGFRLTLRASVIAVTHGFGDVNRYATRGAFVVQLWHGIPFKRIHIDSPAALRVPFFSRFGITKRILRAGYAYSGRGIGLFPVASEVAGARIATAFAIGNDTIAVTGDPRDDALIGADADDLAAYTRARVADLLGDDRVRTARLVMYAPTWRDGAADPSLPTHDDWERIASYLDDTDALLVIRSHPLGSGDYAAGAAASDRVLMLGADLQGDITPLLPAFDALVTDYSSIAFDYALLGRPILFLAPDVSAYTASRGVYEPYADFSGGTEVSSWRHLVELLRTVDTDPDAAERLRAHAQWLAGRFHTYRDGRNTQRVYQQIRARIGGTIAAEKSGTERATTVERVEVDPGNASGGADADEHARPTLILHGRGVSPARASLIGRGPTLTSTVENDMGGWSVRIPLAASAWGGPLLPPPSGDYAVRLADDDDRPVDVAVTAELPSERRFDDYFRLAFRQERGSLVVSVSAPLDDDERGTENQARLEAAYRATREPLTNAVFFESFWGQNASCNPRGIDRALARSHPEITRYWGVADASVQVPVGAVTVIEGSAAWWNARATARVIVINDWLRKRYRKRAGQAVLQTWHGTPLKRLALDRRGVRRLRANVAALLEKARWNIMLAQNEFSASVFRAAYAFRGPIWQEGYPRDDVLRDVEDVDRIETRDDADAVPTASAVRSRLGIDATSTVVLYAPTWRDDRPGNVDHVDAQSLATRLGPRFTVLVRGHSRTLRAGAGLDGHGVVDVSRYPDISELFLAADALVTDYSSVMFDFSVTGKPILFYVPDLADYRDRLRGFTFDLLPIAPGPILDGPDALVERLRDLPGVSAEFGQRYAAWQARFNPRDDGHAGERVVARMFDEGLLRPPG